MRRHILFGLLAGLVLSTQVSATIIRQEWDEDIDASRDAIIEFLGDLANPVPVPDVEEIMDESYYHGDHKDYYVAKFYGWVTVPTTGTYQFHYACDDYGMLYVSQDEEMANAEEVAYVDGWCADAEWDKYDTQHSEPMELRAGQVMAVMAFFQEDGGGDNMDIAWTGPGMSSDPTNPTYLTDYITHIPPAPTKAKNPSPDVEATDVPRETALSWTAGRFAATHDVYLGTVFNDVNEASRDDPRGVLVSQGQAEASYQPPTALEFGETYYWRIDEVNAPPDETIFTGKIWQFTVEPFGYPVEDLIVSTNAIFVSGSLSAAVDETGLDSEGQHSTNADHMWLGEPNGADPIVLNFEFPQIYKLHEMVVWNYNVQFELMLGMGLKDVTVEYSADGLEWTVLGDFEFAQATASSTDTANTAVAFGGVPVQYVRLTANTRWGGVSPTFNQFGVSELQFLYVPAHAREPEPADAATGTSVSTSLSWRAGREALSHEVYLGLDPEALSLVATEDTASFAPETLDLDTTYYWQIDEVNEADAVSVWPGSLWSFTTQEFLMVDDFESYTDNEGSRIYETWEDGWVNDSGSTVGYFDAPFAETAIVHGGYQAMPLFYDNSGVTVAEADFTPAEALATGNATTLTLYFHGQADNSGQLYVKVNGTRIDYDGDAQDIARSMWHPWNIDLTAAGVNASTLTSITVGVDGSGAEGTLFVDDVRLYAETPEYIVPVEPSDDGLVAHYTFDEGSGTTVADASGNGNDGTVGGDPIWVTSGVIGGAMQFSGNDYVDCGNDDSLAIRDAITVACWIKIASFSNDWETIIGMGDDSYRMSRSSTTGNALHFGCNGPTVGGNLDGKNIITDDTWHHAALVYDGVNKYIYVDGIEDARVATEGQIDVSSYNLYIGENAQATGRYLHGLVDDVRIYNRALSPEEVAGLSGRTEQVHKSFE